MLVCCLLAVGARPDGGGPQPAPPTRFEVSPDGSWLAVQAETKGRQGQVWLVPLAGGGARLLGQRHELAPAVWTTGNLVGLVQLDAARHPDEVRWLDPASGETRHAHSFKEHPEAVGLELSAAPWGRVVEGKRGARWLEWIARDQVHELPKGCEEVQITAVPGVAFYALRGGAKLQIFRLDLANAATTRVLESAASAIVWQVAPDGEALAVVDEQRTRVWSLDGRQVGGPWPAGEVRWSLNLGSRFLLLCVHGRCELLDLRVDGGVDLGEGSGPWAAQVLDDGRMVVRNGASLELRAADGSLVRALYPPAGG